MGFQVSEISRETILWLIWGVYYFQIIPIFIKTLPGLSFHTILNINIFQNCAFKLV